MKYKLITILSLVLLAALVTAGVLSNWEKDIDLTAKQITQIKESGKVNKIDVIVSEIKCDNKECWVKVFQEDVINSEFRTLKDYCIKYSECDYEKEPECEVICLEYKDYIIDELKQMATDYVNKRLGGWADAEIERKNKGSGESVTGEGKVSEK